MASNEFSTQDLLQHPTFRKWVLEHDEAATAFWSAWLSEHPHQEATVKDAAEILKAIGGQSVPANAMADTWRRMWQTISEAERTGQRPAEIIDIRRPNHLRRWLAYAAMAAGATIAVVSTWQFYSDRKTEYHTAMGELKTIELPDHSEIRLNVNSTVRYAKRWSSGSKREIWLNGEAYFSVAHQNGQAFIVHTNDVDINVLGTEFNVNTRRIKTQVVLNTGVVQLLLNGDHEKKTRAILMKPGDMITYSAATAELSNKKVDPQDYSSWQKRVLIYDDAKIRDVIRDVQDNMNIIIESTDTSLGTQTFTGSIPLNNIDVFFKTLSRSFDVKIEQTATNTYRISSNN